MNDSLTSEEKQFILSDGHTTRADALLVASEMHELAEECANACEDITAARLSAGAAILEMAIAEIDRLREEVETLTHQRDTTHGELVHTQNARRS